MENFKYVRLISNLFKITNNFQFVGVRLVYVLFASGASGIFCGTIMFVFRKRKVFQKEYQTLLGNIKSKHTLKKTQRSCKYYD